MDIKTEAGEGEKERKSEKERETRRDAGRDTKETKNR